MEIKLLKDVGCPQWVINHSILVSNISLNIAEYYPEVDKDLIKTGALLHDIGRSKTNNIDHGYVGGEILTDLDFPIEVIHIVERHIGTGISIDDAKAMNLPIKNYIPQTLEEKIVSHADNLTNGSDFVDVEFTAKKWRKRLGNNHPSIKQLYKNHEDLIISKGVEL